MIRETIQIGDFALTIHGLFAGLGLIFGAILARTISSTDIKSRIIDYILVVAFAGLIGARISYALIYHNQFNSFWSALSLTGGGFISYGGMILGAIVLYLVLRWRKEDVGKIFDIVATAFFLGLGIGRIGEILSGEFSGKVVSSNIAQAYLSRGVFATPVFEAILCFLIVGLALKIIQFKKIKPGQLTLILILIYTFVRFIIDFGRVENKLIWNLSPGQICGLVLFIFSAILLVRAKNNKMKRDPSTPPTKLGRSG